ncbi:MAG: hypothetical protein ACKOTF_04950, partial [Opitutaceae bacterium]
LTEAGSAVRPTTSSKAASRGCINPLLLHPYSAVVTQPRGESGARRDPPSLGNLRSNRASDLQDFGDADFFCRVIHPVGEEVVVEQQIVDFVTGVVGRLIVTYSKRLVLKLVRQVNISALLASRQTDQQRRRLTRKVAGVARRLSHDPADGGVARC